MSESSRGDVQAADTLAEFLISPASSPAFRKFTLEDLWLDQDGAGIDYLGHDGRRVRAFLRFSEAGNISRSACAPWALGAPRTWG